MKLNNMNKHLMFIYLFIKGDDYCIVLYLLEVFWLGVTCRAHKLKYSLKRGGLPDVLQVLFLRVRLIKQLQSSVKPNPGLIQQCKEGEV